MRLRSLVRSELKSFRDFKIIGDYQVEFHQKLCHDPKKRFEKEMFNRAKTKEYGICLNPLVRDYSTGKSLFMKRAVKLRFSFYDFPVPSALFHEVWFSPESLTIELLKHGEK